jgi:hypothetical protein
MGEISHGEVVMENNQRESYQELLSLSQPYMLRSEGSSVIVRFNCRQTPATAQTLFQPLCGKQIAVLGTGFCSCSERKNQHKY